MIFRQYFLWMCLIFALVCSSAACATAQVHGEEPGDTTASAMQVSADPQHGAPVQTQTVTPAPTASPPPPTATALPSPTPTPTRDVSAVGEPVTPYPWIGFTPREFLSYNEADFFVYRLMLHGRPVTVAWAKDTGVAEEDARRKSELYFQSFIDFWPIFQGNLYEGYTVVVRNKTNYNYQSMVGIGYEQIYADLSGDFYHPHIAHEVFHIWMGNAIQDRQEEYYEDTMWMREGIATYYGDREAKELYRNEAPGRALVDLYQDRMGYHYAIYQENILQTRYDIALVEMPQAGAAIGEKPPWRGNEYYSLGVYHKGALVAYLMDRRLHDEGFSLDDLMRTLYQKYALKKKTISNIGLLSELNRLTGKDWTDFFRDYVFGYTPLPLEGDRFLWFALPANE